MQTRTTHTVSHYRAPSHDCPSTKRIRLPRVSLPSAHLFLIPCARLTTSSFASSSSERSSTCRSSQGHRFPCPRAQRPISAVLATNQHIALVSGQRGWAPKRCWYRRVVTSGALIRRPTAVGAVELQATGVKCPRGGEATGGAWANEF